MSSPSPAGGDAVAAFDFDGTLTRRDTLVPFLARLTSWSAIGAATARVVGAGHVHRESVKRELIRFAVGGRSKGEVEAAARAYSIDVRSRLRAPLVAQVAWHRDLGHELVVISASLRIYVEPVARTLGFDDVLAVELEEDEDGTLTGELEGANVRGPEKVVRLEGWLGDRRPRLWAYGDSRGDRELLRLADHPVALTRRVERGL
jgi:phosphatidylglycerophosphatase C